MNLWPSNQKSTVLTTGLQLPLNNRTWVETGLEQKVKTQGHGIRNHGNGCGKRKPWQTFGSPRSKYLWFYWEHCGLCPINRIVKYAGNVSVRLMTSVRVGRLTHVNNFPPWLNYLLKPNLLKTLKRNFQFTLSKAFSLYLMTCVLCVFLSDDANTPNC